MKKITLTMAIVFAISVNLIAGNPNVTTPMNVQGTAKQGNVIGTTTITIDLGIIKIERTTVDCDGQKDRVCYMEKGESSSSNTVSIHLPSINTVFGGEYYQDPVITPIEDEGTSTEFYFIKDSYFYYTY